MKKIWNYECLKVWVLFTISFLVLFGGICDVYAGGDLPTVRISYSTTSLTNKDVVATLIPSEEVTVINNGGNTTYTFKENGSFKFEFKDTSGNVGTATAKVTWIDKIVPVAIVEYNTTSSTNGTVTATLKKETEPIKILNNDGKSSYTFKENGSFEFKYSDDAGNINSTIAVVSWINKEQPTAKTTTTTTKKTTIKASTKKATTKKVTTKKATTTTTKKVTTKKPTTSTTKKTTTTKKVESTDDTVNENYIKLEKDGFVLEVPKIEIKDEVELKINRLTLTNSLIEKVGVNSDYFELYLKKANGEKTENVTASNLKITIDSSKRLKDVYRVNESGNLEKYTYNDLGDNKIQLNINHLGKFLVSYYEEENRFVRDSNNSLMGTILVLLVMLAGGVIVYLKTR